MKDRREALKEGEGRREKGGGWWYKKSAHRPRRNFGRGARQPGGRCRGVGSCLPGEWGVTWRAVNDCLGR